MGKLEGKTALVTGATGGMATQNEVFHGTPLGVAKKHYIV